MKLEQENMEKREEIVIKKEVCIMYMWHKKDTSSATSEAFNCFPEDKDFGLQMQYCDTW